MRISNIRRWRLHQVFLGSLTAISAAVLLSGSPAKATSPIIFSSHTHTPSSVDQNGIDLGTGQYVPPSLMSSIGDDSSGMSETNSGPEFHYSGGITMDPDALGNVPEVWANSTHKNDTSALTLVHFAGYRKMFDVNLYTETKNALGCYLALDNSMDVLCVGNPGGDNPFGGINTLTTSDGTVAYFWGSLASDFGTDAKYAGFAGLKKPDGESIAVNYSHTDTPTNADPADDPNNSPVPRGIAPVYVVDATMSDATSNLGWSQYGASNFGSPQSQLINRADPQHKIIASIGVQPRFPAGGVHPLTTGNVDAGYISNQTLIKEQWSTGSSGSYVLDQTVERRDRYVTNNDWTGSIQFAWMYSRQFSSNADNQDLYDENLASGDLLNLISSRYYTDQYTLKYPSGRQIVIDYYQENQHTGQFVDAPLISGGCYTGGTIQAHPLNCVKSVTRGNLVWKYTWGTDTVGTTIYPSVDIEDPLHRHRHLRTNHDNTCGTFVTYDRDELDHVTTYVPGALCQVGKVTYPEGNYVQNTYNSRGDLTQIDTYAKDGVTHTTQSAGYPSTCTLAAAPDVGRPADPNYSEATDYKVCHQPVWTKDAKGNRTDYTYDVVHGGVLTITYPADKDGVQAQTRNVYTQVEPKYLNGTNVVIEDPVWRLHCTVTVPSTVASNATTCATNAQYQVTTYAYDDIQYDPSSLLATNNALVTSVTVSAGDFSQAATTRYGYDWAGNRIWVDGPRTDVDDRSYTTYDIVRRPVFEIGPDPDGSGPLKRQMVHHLYDLDSREYRTENGTGNATDGSDFSINTYVQKIFDPATGVVVRTIVAKP